MRRALVLVLFACLTVSAASQKKKPAGPVIDAPDVVPHAVAQFLRGMSRDGARQVTFRASATGTRFFIEEPSGVTVYHFSNGTYVKEEFRRGAKLAATIKRYAGKP
jgi:hypothetical protein